MQSTFHIYCSCVLSVALVWPASEVSAQAYPHASTTGTPSSARTSSAAVAASSAAQAEPAREMGGHRFPIAVFVPSALTMSHFGIRAGVEYHEVPGFSRNLSFFDTAEYDSVELKTLNAAETADFAIRLHEYVAVVGNVYGLARVGANIETLLGTGADYMYGGEVGVLVKVFRAGGFQLALRAQGGYYSGQQAGIVELFGDIGGIVQHSISEILKDPQVDLNTRLDQLDQAFRTATGEMLTPFNGTTLGASINAAQSLGRYFGAQLSVGVFADSATYHVRAFDATTASLSVMDRDVDKLWPRVAVALDADGSPAGLPLDLLVEYALTPLRVRSNLPDDDIEQSSIEHLLAVGLYYSGRADLQLGATGYVLLGQTPALGANAVPSGKPLDLGAQFVFKYLW